MQIRSGIATYTQNCANKVTGVRDETFYAQPQHKLLLKVIVNKWYFLCSFQICPHMHSNTTTGKTENAPVSIVETKICSLQI